MKRVACALAIAIVGLSSQARAQGTDERAADAAFAEGRATLARGNLLEACNKLAESDRLAPSGRAALNLADCYERRGMTASAYGKFLEAAARAVAARRPDAEKHARERAARLEPRLARVSIVVAKEADVPGLELRRDGKVVPRAAWNVGELVDPGTTHNFEASAPGKNVWTATLGAEEGKTARTELRWQEVPPLGTPPTASPAAKEAKEAPAQPEGPARSSNDKTIGYVSLGVGAAGVLVGVVGGLNVLSAKSTVDTHCNPTTKACDAEGFDAANRGARWSVISPIGFAVGAVGLGLGTYFLFLKPGTETTRAARLTVTPSAGPNGGGFVLGGTL